MPSTSPGLTYPPPPLSFIDSSLVRVLPPPERSFLLEFCAHANFIADSFLRVPDSAKSLVFGYFLVGLASLTLKTMVGNVKQRRAQAGGHTDTETDWMDIGHYGETSRRLAKLLWTIENTL